MRNAQKAAMMALFAAMEENAEAERGPNQYSSPVDPDRSPKSDRPILVNLAALAQRTVKSVA